MATLAEMIAAENAKRANKPTGLLAALKNAGQVIDQGLLGGRIGQIPQRAAEMKQGLLRAPADLAQLGSPAMKQTVNAAMAGQGPATNPQQWIDAGMELTGMAPIGGLVGMTKKANGLLGVGDNAGMGKKSKAIKSYHGSKDPSWIDRGDPFDHTKTANSPSKYLFTSPRKEVAENYAGISETQRWKVEQGWNNPPPETAGIREIEIDGSAKVLKVIDVKKAAKKLGVDWSGDAPLETLLDAAKSQGYDAVKLEMDGPSYAILNPEKAKYGKK